MPWTSKSAHRHTKSANTPAKKKKWAKIAEGLREKYGEGRAIRIANAAVKDRFWLDDLFLSAKWKSYIDRRNKRVTKYDPQGRSEGYEEWDVDDSVFAAPVEDKDKPGETGEAQKNKKWGIRAHRSGKATNEEAGEGSKDEPDHSEWLKGDDGKPLLYENEKDAMDSAERHNGMMENMKKMTFHHARYNEPTSDALKRRRWEKYEEEFDRDHGKPTKRAAYEIKGGHGGVGDAEVNCPTCDGSGLDPNGDGDCPTCGGTGVVEHDEGSPEDIVINTETHHEGLGGPWGSAYWEEALEAAADSDYRAPYTDAIYDREFSAKQRKKAASEGEAMKGGGFPIKNKEDLANARQALGRAKNRAATIRHIKKRAKALGVKLPEGWPNDADPFAGEDSLVSVPSVFGVGPIQSHQTMFDTITLDAGANIRELENGYLAAMPRIARTGIQIYKGSECGRPDLDRVKVFRPADQVFAGSAVHSYTHLPVTLDHPPEAVNTSNWRRYAVGETGDEVLRDGNTVRVPMMLRDSEAIQAFREGTKQLSVGYDCDLDWTDGVTPEGENYDAIQRGIRANHLAVVAAARGGSSLSIGDNTVHKGDNAMNLKTIVVDGYQVQVEDNAAAVIQRTIQTLEAKYRDAFKKLKEK